jgi:hypothetical protein
LLELVLLLAKFEFFEFGLEDRVRKEYFDVEPE